jgi:hypothetical protein
MSFGDHPPLYFASNWRTRAVHYTNFAEFKCGVLEAGFPQGDGKNDAKIDILFAYYKQARGPSDLTPREQSNLTLGRLNDTQALREKQGSVFDGGKGQLLLTPKASGFSTSKPVPAATAGKTALPRGLMAGEWKEWTNGEERTSTVEDWKKKTSQEQMETLLGSRWSIWLNDSFILGGIHSHRSFCLVSQISSHGDPAAKFVFNVTQRELIGLVRFGYSKSAPTPLGTEYKCTKELAADGATFKAYVDEIERLSADTRAGRSTLSL